MRSALGSRLAPPLAAAFIVFLLAQPAAAQVLLPPNFQNDVFAGGLDQPVSFAFLPDGRVLLTEQKSGKVRMVVNGHVAATDPALVVPGLTALGEERGLLGITVDPAWPARPFVYLYYDHTGDFCRLVRYTASGNLTDSSAENVTLGSPLVLMDDIPDQTIYHQAGCLRFGPDGMLYVSTGDDAYDCLAFDVRTLHGNILRLKVDGLPAGSGPQVLRSAITPPGNPFAASPDSNAKLVWAWGLRNPWRFQIDPATGVIITCDVGDNDFEEMDEIQPGGFYGWPYREGDMIRVLTDCPEPGGSGSTPYIHPIAEIARDTDSHAIVSGGMYRPAPGGVHNWPSAYYPSRGDVFYTDYFTGTLWRITWNGSAWVPATPVAGQPTPDFWGTGFVTATDFQVGPDGSLWWMRQFDDNFDASSGTLNRVRFTGITGVEPGGPSPRVLFAAPNPFGRVVDLSFRLAAAEHVRLAIYDLGGRRVSELLDGAAPAGESRFEWDGRDDRGIATAAGVYFARLERPGSTVTVPLFRRK